MRVESGRAAFAVTVSAGAGAGSGFAGFTGGAGGGIKITTFAVFLTTLLAICRGRRDTVMLERAVPEAVVREATVIVIVFAALVTCAMTVLLVSEDGISFEHLLFETVSAVTTTGLTCADTTVSLSTVGRVVIMVCMFCGRLGAIAIVTLIGGQSEQSTIRYAKEELVVG